jgi:arsenite methyltransferase
MRRDRRLKGVVPAVGSIHKKGTVMSAAATIAFDPRDLEAKVKDMYRAVAENPHGEFHFEMGRPLAERLGYPASDLDRIPADAITSFAGVGYYFHLAGLRPGETVVDLGSGSGMDTFVAALHVGERGRVIGIDMTDEQRAKAERLRDADGFHNVGYVKGYIEAVPLPDASADVVISNGVINLATDKGKVFGEAARLLKSGGRLAISDIVTEVQLPESIVCNSTLWAECVVGASVEEDYLQMFRSAGFDEISILRGFDYFSGSSNADTRRIAGSLGARAIELRMLRPH